MAAHHVGAGSQRQHLLFEYLGEHGAASPHAADLHQVELDALEVQLADDRAGQLPQLIAGPAYQINGHRVALARYLKDQRGVCGREGELLAHGPLDQFIQAGHIKAFTKGIG
ncbi:hypothetical protein SDC9_176356 [bioreactor metagenome]|uniref:Uncharacterized protein n=1 Tax=bioreactor metagenome TaxID=1076179 RepID=A0A645GPS2_9ZZZZ